MKSIVIDKNQVLKFLGYGEREPHSKIIDMVNSEVEKLQEYMKPEFYSKVIDIKEVVDNKVILENDMVLEEEYLYNQLKDCKAIAVNVATIGNEVGILENEYISRRESMRAIICDKIAVVALDAIVDENRNKLSMQLKEYGFNISSETSPGEGGVSLENQKLIFKLLEHENMCVKLNEFCMMEPTKSSSFIWGIGKGKSMDCGHRCSRCKNPCGFKDGNW